MSFPDYRKKLKYTGNAPQREQVFSASLKWFHDLRVVAIQVQTALEIDMGGRKRSVLVGEKSLLWSLSCNANRFGLFPVGNQFVLSFGNKVNEISKDFG